MIARRVWSTSHYVGRAVIDLVFPWRCPLCGERSGRDGALTCDDCSFRLDQERRTPTCPRCAATVAPYEVDSGRCRWCRHRRPVVAATCRVAPYHRESGPGDDDLPRLSGHGWLLRRYKYGGREELGPILAGSLAEVVTGAPWRDRIEAIVSVPTHWRHRLGRPFYAAEAIARLVARQTGLPLAQVLKRTKAGPHQIGLSYTERVQNVRGKFALRRGVTMTGAHVLLIDDVMTTGATLNECARVLRRGGASEVYGAVVVTAGGAQRAPEAPTPTDI